MNQIKAQIVRKLNVIVELVRLCAAKALPTQDQLLMQEVSLAVITHEGLCKLLEQEGESEKVVTLTNEFGRAVADLYKNIINFKPAPVFKMPPLTNKRQDKNLLN
jgi:hypothetical protein